ncbi:MAG: ATP cone domain-containing protein [Planctomycetota bacterium]
MRRNPEIEPDLTVVKRDGRRVAFEAARLAASLCRALEAADRMEPSLAGDLAGVVETSLRTRSGGTEVAADEITALACDVLLGAGCAAASHAYRAERDSRARARGALRIRKPGDQPVVRAIPPADRLTGAEDPEAWSKGRVVALLQTETDLPGAVAADVAAGVERTLFASGLHSISTALLREWVDNELDLRGQPPRVGRQQYVALAAHELRAILASGAAGLEAETQVASRLLQRYALHEVFPEPVRSAHEQGLLCLEALGSGGRFDTLALPVWRLPVAGTGAARRARLRAIGPTLRNLAQLASRDVLVLWDGPALAAEPAADLLASIADAPLGAASSARVMLCLPADRPALSAPFVTALTGLREDALRRGLRLPSLRLPAAGLPDAVLDDAVRLEGIDGRVQFATGAPAPGVVTASVAVNVARIALAVGPRRIADFLDGLGRATELALSALAAQDALMGADDGPARALRLATGLLDARLPRRRRLALCGALQAATVLLGDGARGRENRIDLAAAIAERLAPLLEPAGGGLIVGMGSDVTRDRFGRLDLAAFPAARDQLALAAHREGFRYDGAETLPAREDPFETGRAAARYWQLLGATHEAAVPRCTGGTAERLAYVSGYLSVMSPVPDLHPCG